MAGRHLLQQLQIRLPTRKHAYLEHAGENCRAATCNGHQLACFTPTWRQTYVQEWCGGRQHTPRPEIRQKGKPYPSFRAASTQNAAGICSATCLEGVGIEDTMRFGLRS